MTSEFRKSQLNAVLSALDGQPRNPNTKDAALRAIERHAERLGVGLNDLLAAADGLLDGRLSGDDFRAQLCDESAGDSLEGHDVDGVSDTAGSTAGAPQAAETVSEATVAATGGDANEPSVGIGDRHAVDHPMAAANARSWPTGESRPTVGQQLLAACQAAEHWLQALGDRPGETPDDILRVLRDAIARAEGQPHQPRRPRDRQRQPRPGSKEAKVITLLRRPEGATLAQVGETTGWQTHTVRGFFAAALKQRHGLRVTSEKAGGGKRTYRIAD
jgi:Protein of unknown function (DUF3489)